MTGKLTIHIELGNDAMSTPSDVAAELERIANTLRYEDGFDDGGGTIRDQNGNTVGEWTVQLSE